MNVTIENLAQASERDVVETIAFHMLRQGKRSRDANTCVYRNSEGLSCAAGVLLSDEKAKEFEGLTWLSCEQGRGSGRPCLQDKGSSVHP